MLPLYFVPKFILITSNRVKKNGESGSARSWWERSAYSKNNTSFCGIHSYGGAGADGTNGASCAHVVAPRLFILE